MARLSPRRVAVLAHFDAQGLLGVYARRLLDELLLHVERVVLVSTQLLPEHAIGLDPRVQVIIRENIGYDFYSFRTGVLAIEDLYAYDELVIANDSVVPVRGGGLGTAFEEMSRVDCDAWAMTESHQVARHLQSWFLVFRKSAFFTRHFLDFWQGVRVLHNKWEIILSYEVGLTQWLLAHDVRIASALVPTRREKRSMARRLASKLGRKPSRQEIRSANPAHYLWDVLCQRYGLIKTEVLRDDPNGVLADALPRVVDADEMPGLRGEMDRLKRGRKHSPPLGTPREDAADPELMKRLSLSVIDPGDLHGDVAVVLHLYHVDLLESIDEYLRNVICRHDIFISVKSEADHRTVTDYFGRSDRNAFVYLHPNIGRDVGPFVSLLNSGLLDRYEAVCKIHSKKSVYHEEGSAWRDELLKPLLGTSQQVLAIRAAFQAEDRLGIVGPERSYVNDSRFWGGNELRLRNLAAEIGIDQAFIRLGFFAGTMFWVRPTALAGLRKRRLALDEFDPETGQRDATLAHVIERIVTLCTQDAGYFVATTRDPRRELDHESYSGQGVRVLPSSDD